MVRLQLFSDSGVIRR